MTPSTDYPAQVRATGVQGQELYDACVRELTNEGYSAADAATLTIMCWDELAAGLTKSSSSPIPPIDA